MCKIKLILIWHKERWENVVTKLMENVLAGISKRVCLLYCPKVQFYLPNAMIFFFSKKHLDYRHQKMALDPTLWKLVDSI